MFRHIQHILSGRNKSHWELHNPSAPAQWSNLPVEMRREIVKHTDLLTRIRLRACSKLDREIVDSLSINIPFVRLKADYDDFTITFIEHPKSVLKVDVSKRKFRKNRAVVHLSNNINGSSSIELHPKYNCQEVLESFLDILTRKNVHIGTLNLSIRNNMKIHEFLNKNYHFTIPNLPRIVCSGLEFLPCFLESVQIDEIRLGNDSLTKFESNDGKLIAGRHIDLIPFGYRESKCEVIRPSVLRCNLGALIAGILHNINTPWRFYWLPGYEETEHVTLCERYSGRLDKLPNNIHVLLIPVPENDELKLLVKVSECGVTIQKFARIDLPQNLQKISDKTCGLSWMCKNCDKSMESWYFRKTLNVD